MTDLFRSFWLAGFESACQINRLGVRVDMIAITQHDIHAAEDYAMLRDFNIRAARDGIRWHLADRGGGRYDFSALDPLLAAAERAGVQVIWNLCHYGWPDGVDIFTPAFVDRFAKYAGAAARYIREHTGEVPFFSPVNEISFFSWAASRFMYPFAQGRDNELKEQLVRAAIAACEAIWDVEPRARIVHGDPIIHTVPPRGRPDLAEGAARYEESQFAAWDMLAGREKPSLGGHPRYLDIVGCNFYHDNQWEVPGGTKIAWHILPRDERWVPLHRLLTRVYERYRRPLFLAETSHFGEGRALWVRETAQEVCQALAAGVPVAGICLYPILDRPDWEDHNRWHNSGLWDLTRDENGRLRRVLNEEYAAALRAAQAMLSSRQRSQPT